MVVFYFWFIFAGSSSEFQSLVHIQPSVASMHSPQDLPVFSRYKLTHYGLSISQQSFQFLPFKLLFSAMQILNSTLTS